VNALPLHYRIPCPAGVVVHKAGAARVTAVWFTYSFTGQLPAAVYGCLFLKHIRVTKKPGFLRAGLLLYTQLLYLIARYNMPGAFDGPY
jgi:hypothetical protein